MKKFNITVQPVSLWGFKIPAGAMYGRDNKGVWICLDYRIKSVRTLAKAHYVKMRDENGAWRSVCICPKKTAPVLKLLRENESAVNGVKWDAVYEHGKTVDKILELCDRYPEKTVEYASAKITRQEYNFKTGEWESHQYGYVTNSQSKKLAGGLGLARPSDGRMPYNMIDNNINEKYQVTSRT